jgi:hypothetical protein
MGKSFVLLFTFLIILAKSSAQTSIEYCGTLYYRNYRDEPGSIVFLKDISLRMDFTKAFKNKNAVEKFNVKDHQINGT